MASPGPSFVHTTSLSFHRDSDSSAEIPSPSRFSAEIDSQYTTAYNTPGDQTPNSIDEKFIQSTVRRCSVDSTSDLSEYANSTNTTYSRRSRNIQGSQTSPTNFPHSTTLPTQRAEHPFREGGSPVHGASSFPSSSLRLSRHSEDSSVSQRDGHPRDYLPTPRTPLRNVIALDDNSSSQYSDFSVPSARVQEQDEVQYVSVQRSNEIGEHELAGPDDPVQKLGGLVTLVDEKPTFVDTEGSLTAKGKKDVRFQKRIIHAAQIGLNGFCIFGSWWWTKYYYVFLPLITITVALNCIMIFSILFFQAKHALFPEKIIASQTPEPLVLLIPCYNETEEELIKSLDSLVDQVGVDQHRRSIVIICDGRVRGPDMKKTTADYLLEDILVHYSSRKDISKAYVAWDKQLMSITMQKGLYKGIPYVCVVKKQNQGKRDSLILIRSFLYNFNRRDERPATIFSNKLFGELASFLVNDSKIDRVDHLIGMDADTVFDKHCVSELLKASRYKDVVGVCGYVAVDFEKNNWSLWQLYQSAEYTISQGLRRLHQSKVTNKVSCLPGCCQLLRVCEETCGDHVLRTLFGYCPPPTDNIILQIRATASEDRNHVCNMLTARPNSKTRQALSAKAFTDVPHSWSVFLSQRRRWTLGATGNDVLLFYSKGTQWFERILAGANITTWFLNPFILTCVAALIHAALITPWWIIMAFATVMIVPLMYYVLIVTWLPRTWTSKAQYLVGGAIYVIVGPFLNIAVYCYASYYMDSFAWGKTRKVVAEDPVTAPIEVADAEKATAPTSIREDVEATAGLRQLIQRTSFPLDLVGITGEPPDIDPLLNELSRKYRTIFYSRSEVLLKRIRKKYPPNHSTHFVETTHNLSTFLKANIIFVATNSSPPHDMAWINNLENISAGAKPGDLIVIHGRLPGPEDRELAVRMRQKFVLVAWCAEEQASPEGSATERVMRVVGVDEESFLRAKQAFERVWPEVVRGELPPLLYPSPAGGELGAHGIRGSESDDVNSETRRDVAGGLSVVLPRYENGAGKVKPAKVKRPPRVLQKKFALRDVEKGMIVPRVRVSSVVV